MRKHIHTLLLLLAATCSALHGSYQACPVTTFVGTVSFPSALTRTPDLPAYYKGSHFEIKDGSYSVKEEMCVQEFFILFTLSSVLPQAKASDDCNTINNLVMPSANPYKCYKITHSINPYNRYASRRQLTWNIVPIKLSKSGSNLILPDNTIIILANPNYVAGLEQDAWKSYNNTYRLPKVLFKESTGEKAIQDMANEALLVSLDLNAFHRKPQVLKEVAPHKPSIVVSMAEQ